MEVCNRCKQSVTISDYSARGPHVGSPGLHVRRSLCGCGCKRVQFYTVMNVSLLRTSSPIPGRESAIPAKDFPIFKAHNYVNA